MVRKTPWAQFLGNAVVDHLHRMRPERAVIVDLGAGPNAVIARHLIDEFPDYRYIAVEPFCEVDAPPGVPVFDRLQRIDEAPDYILFNPPSLPTEWIDHGHEKFHAWNGGPSGNDIIHMVIEEAFSLMPSGSRFIFLCASFHDFRKPPGTTMEVMTFRYDPTRTLAERAPLAVPVEDTRGWLSDMVEISSGFWCEHGVEPREDTYAMCVVSLTRD